MFDVIKEPFHTDTVGVKGSNPFVPTSKFKGLIVIINPFLYVVVFTEPSPDFIQSQY